MSAAPELSCAELVELLSDYLDERLPPSERARFRAHLAQCPHCVEYLEQMRATLRLASRLRADELPASVRAGLLAAFRGWKNGER